MTKEEKSLILKKLKEELEHAKFCLEQMFYHVEQLEENFHKEFGDL